MPVYSIIDIETTGGDPKRDRITEIAILKFDGEQLIDRFESLINPCRHIPEEITRVTGITNDMVAHAPRFYEIAKQVVQITEGSIFVAHNVRFDYSFIQKEFRQLGYTFSRKQLCTVKLSKKLIPGFPSYSLGKLCKKLGITIENRHRAAGDATATLVLFQKLLTEAQEGFDDTLSAELKLAKLPPHLSPEVFTTLPEETGVYFFHDKDGKVIYTGKSNNIRKRIMQHFQSAYLTKRSIRMLEKIHDISYELTGSEIVALLKENEEIKALQPTFNRAQRRKVFKAGVFSELNAEGYIALYAGKLEDHIVPPVAYFPTVGQAEASLQSRVNKQELCPKLCSLEKGNGRCFHFQLHLCHGACVSEEEPEAYNERVMEAISQMNYGKTTHSNFLIITEGRTYQERSVVCVKEGVYQGYTYLEEDMLSQPLTEILENIPYKAECPDVHRIIRAYVRRHPKEIHTF
ncbi:MAG: exonuclease domain-containing protein [Bacteroidota bacterium]